MAKQKKKNYGKGKKSRNPRGNNKYGITPKFTPAELAAGMRKKMKDMEWTRSALADYLEIGERQVYRYLNKEGVPRSAYFRRLFAERLGIGR
jgi:DNA invertase Pin-like site-specific DNA recombinase